MNSYSRGPEFENQRSGSLKTLNGSGSTANLTRKLKESATILYNKEHFSKHTLTRDPSGDL